MAVSITLMPMSYSTIFLVALALAVDAFAVALTVGVSLGRVDSRQTFRLAFHFGLFQSLMNIGGWAAGLTVRSLIERADHWIAFCLLCLVGLHMIFTGEKDGEKKQQIDPTKGGSLVILSVATSIDALAVGLSFSVLQISIWGPALMIGIVAAALTILGLRLGRLVGAASKLGDRAEILGGLFLLGIGLHILHGHGVF